MQGIPSRLKKHYEECWLEKVLEADAVEDDPMSILADEMQMTSDDPVWGTSSSSLEPSTSVSTTATMASQKRTRVTHRYASLSVVCIAVCSKGQRSCKHQWCICWEDWWTDRKIFLFNEYAVFPCWSWRVHSNVQRHETRLPTAIKKTVEWRNSWQRGCVYVSWRLVKCAHGTNCVLFSSTAKWGNVLSRYCWHIWVISYSRVSRRISKKQHMQVQVAVWSWTTALIHIFIMNIHQMVKNTSQDSKFNA